MYIKSNGINDNKLLFSEFLPNCLSILSDTIFEKNIKNNIDNIIIYGNFNNKKNIANFNLTFEDKMDLLNIGSKYAKEFIENQSKLICSDIINNIINNIII
jgi:hypothetical protein